MKKLVLLLALIVPFAACKKEENAAPATPHPERKYVRFGVIADSTYTLNAGAARGQYFQKDMDRDTSIILYGYSGDRVDLIISSAGFNTGYLYLEGYPLLVNNSPGGVGHHNRMHFFIP